MSKKWRDLLRGLLSVVVASVVLVIVLAFFVAWIAWRSGAPIPVT